MSRALLVTVPHTGTRFVRKFLSSVLYVEYVSDPTKLWRNPFRTLIPVRAFSHWHTTDVNHSRYINEARGFPLVITLRDPVLSFLTACAHRNKLGAAKARERQPPEDQMKVDLSLDQLFNYRAGPESILGEFVVGWDNLIEAWENHLGPKYVVPVDAPLGYEERYKILLDLARGLHFYSEQQEFVVQNYALQWKPEGSSGMSPLKQAYFERDETPCDISSLKKAQNFYEKVLTNDI